MRSRRGIIEDVPNLIPIFQRFIETELKDYPIKFDIKIATETITVMTKSHLTIVLEVEDPEQAGKFKIVGAISGLVVKSLMGDEVVFQEIFFYVLEEYRRLSRCFLQDIKTICEYGKVNKIVLSSFQNEILGKFYMANGYKFLETHYYMNL